MSISRRHFLEMCGAVAVGFSGLYEALRVWPALAVEEPPLGPLVPDPDGLLDLPEGFSYRIISTLGDEMSDGLIVPGMPDAMATFAGPDAETIIICNHELEPQMTGAFGQYDLRADRIDRNRVYDHGGGRHLVPGGTTTLIFDTKTQTLRKQFLSLAGTVRNCAGGPTPWNTWISCEETTLRAHSTGAYILEKDHGYNFEVPATTEPALAEPVPLIAMGRFQHEAVAVDPRTSIVYQTEDQWDGLIYRFIPHTPTKLRDGGRLQVLAVIDRPSLDTRNWPENDTHVAVGDRMPVRWLDVDNVESPEDDLRVRGFEVGAARFARAEGMWFGRGEVYFACTNGGSSKIGQIWRYTPSPSEGSSGEQSDPGTLELFIEPNDAKIVENADNLTVAPWGDIILCEDRGDVPARLVCVTASGKCFTFARHHRNAEFAGAVFSPDGSTLFVNIQLAGLTLAITGPWPSAHRM